MNRGESPVPRKIIYDTKVKYMFMYIRRVYDSRNICVSIKKYMSLYIGKSVWSLVFMLLSQLEA